MAQLAWMASIPIPANVHPLSPDPTATRMSMNALYGLVSARTAPLVPTLTAAILVSVSTDGPGRIVRKTLMTALEPPASTEPPVTIVSEASFASVPQVRISL